MRECPKKAIVYLTYIYNACIRLHYFPKNWKKAKVIMLPKSGKPLDNPDSFRPISLLPILSKIFEKLICKRLLSIPSKLNIVPDHQFGFRANHAAIEQVHRVTTTLRNALEAKEFCPAVFLYEVKRSTEYG